MKPNDNQGSPFHSISRAIFGGASRREPPSVSGNSEFNVDELELESFLKLVNDRFHELWAVGGDEFLSIAWLQKLLDAFVCCQEEFRGILFKYRDLIVKPPIDRLLAELLERDLKALDICNATRDGIERIRMWQRHLEIILFALDTRQRAVCEGQFRRARKALMDLAIQTLDDKDSGSVFSQQRNRSFGRQQTSNSRPVHARSQSWSVSRSWSAAKQLLLMANNLVPPRGNEIAATNGLAVSVFAMSSVLVFVLWTLVAAIPCQDRGLNVHFTIPRQFSWGNPLLLLYERITEESKKRERRNSSGLLKEINQIERSASQLTDLVDLAQFPLPEEQRSQLELGVQELTVVFEAFQNGLDPLERQMRDVFRKIMTSRTEGLELLESC